MRRFLIGVLCTVVCLALLAGCAQSTTVFKGSGEKETNITLRIVTMDNEKLFDDKVKIIDDEPTVYKALKAAADEKELTLDIVGEDTPDMMFLNGINDLLSENPDFWMYYINQNMAESGMGTQSVKDGDVVEFIYGDFNNGYVEVK